MISEIEGKVLLGDVREVAQFLPDDFFQAIITSPPYFGHRAYSDAANEQEIGRESDPRLYIENLVRVFSVLRCKLRSDALLWLNLGDTYRDKSLLGIPWRVALALQDDGWILRSDIIWHKPNAMPSSIKDRPTTDHEYVFMLARSPDYFYNADAIREPHVTFTERSRMKGGRSHFGKQGGTPEAGKNKGNNNLHDGRWDQAFHPKGRNKRTVWEIPLSKFRDAHFAVYPERLVEVCVLASTKEGDCILDPFTGSGTTGVVASKLSRRFVGIELVSDYQAMAQKRINDATSQPGLFDSLPISSDDVTS
ncbi:MAG: site-specific DNA-methyltransferase [Anaerolineae bacterium]